MLDLKKSRANIFISETWCSISERKASNKIKTIPQRSKRIS